MSDDELIARLRNREGFVLEGPRRLMQACEEAANTIDRMRRANADRVAELAAKGARIAELEAALSQVDNQREVFFRQKQEAEAQLAEAKSALSAMEAQHGRLGDAAINGILTGMESTADAASRIASLEKSVTVLRELIPTLIEAAELGGIAWMPIWNRARAALAHASTAEQT